MVIGLVMLVVAIAVVAAPLRSKQRRSSPASELPELASQYQDTLLALRDLDFDHELGVIAEDDYFRLREELVARAAKTLRKSRPGHPAAGRKVAASTDRARGECPQCGHSFQPDHKFCGACGTRLPGVPHRRGPRPAD